MSLNSSQCKKNEETYRVLSDLLNTAMINDGRYPAEAEPKVSSISLFKTTSSYSHSACKKGQMENWIAVWIFYFKYHWINPEI